MTLASSQNNCWLNMSSRCKKCKKCTYIPLIFDLANLFLRDLNIYVLLCINPPTFTYLQNRKTHWQTSLIQILIKEKKRKKYKLLFIRYKQYLILHVIMSKKLLINGSVYKQIPMITFAIPKNINRFLEESIQDDPKVVPESKYPVESPAALAVHNNEIV